MTDVPPTYSDDELLPKRFPKRQIPQPKFFNRDEQNCVYEEEIENHNDFESNTSDFEGLAKHTKRFSKPQTHQPKFFNREENIVYEDSHDSSSKPERGFEKISNEYITEYDLSDCSKAKQDDLLNKFTPDTYDLFNHEKEFSSSEEDGYFDGHDSESEEYEVGDDADDEYECSELDEDDVEGEDIAPQENHGQLYTDITSFEEAKPLIAQLTRRTKRVYQKKMRPNPINEETAEPSDENVIKEQPSKRDTDIKMPEEPPNDYWYPKPGDPEYVEPIIHEIGTPWKPFYQQARAIFPSDDESSELPGSLRSDYITDTSENYSTETYIDSDELSTCPEDGPEYPQIPEEFYEKPEKIEFENEFLRVPEGNPEVRTWYDCKAREYLDVKNEKGEWVTVEEVISEYPPKPKHPDRWDHMYQPDPKKEENCTCDEPDLTGWYDEYSKYQPPYKKDTESDPTSPYNDRDSSAEVTTTNNNFEKSKSQNLFKTKCSEFKSNDNNEPGNQNSPLQEKSIYNDTTYSANVESKRTCEDIDVADKNNICKGQIQTTTSKDYNKDPNDRGDTSDSSGSSGGENDPGDIPSNGSGSLNKISKHSNNYINTRDNNSEQAKNLNNNTKNQGNNYQVFSRHKGYKDVLNSIEFINRTRHKRRRKLKSLENILRFNVTTNSKLKTFFDYMFPYVHTLHCKNKIRVKKYNNERSSQVRKNSLLNESPFINTVNTFKAKTLLRSVHILEKIPYQLSDSTKQNLYGIQMKEM